MTDRLHFFLHIPKTAGTTLSEVLAANYPAKSILEAYDHAAYRRIRALDARSIAGLRLMLGHIFIHDYEEFFGGEVPLAAFTFLREPVARVVSEYHFLRSWPGQHLYTMMNEEDISLAQFVETNRQQLRHHGKNLMTKSLCGAQKNDTDEAMLERAWSNLSERFACFGLVERFDESLLLLGQALGLSTLFYDRRNVNPDRPARQDLNPATRKIIEDHNALDLELYARAASLLDARIKAQGEPFQARLRTFRKVNERFQNIAKKLLQKGQERFKDYTPK